MTNPMTRWIVDAAAPAGVGVLAGLSLAYEWLNRNRRQTHPPATHPP